MKKIVFLALMLFFSTFCFAEDDGFMEEYIDLNMEQPRVQKEEKINNKEFPPNKEKCQFCDFKSSCKYSALKTTDDDFKVTIADLI